MYAIVKTGGKQYRVEQGQSLLVERLPVSEGESVSLDPLLYVDGSKVVDQVDGLSGVTVEARVVAHERGPKLRIVKFKPKRGYKRRNGHRQELTRIEVVSLKLAGRRKRSGPAAASEEPAPVAAEAVAPAEAEATPTEAAATEAPATEAPATEAAATEAAATEAPAIEAPATEAAATEAPATEAPKPRRPRASAGSTPKPRAASKPKGGESEGAATPKRPAQRRPRAKPKEEGDGT